MVRLAEMMFHQLQTARSLDIRLMLLQSNLQDLSREEMYEFIENFFRDYHFHDDIKAVILEVWLKLLREEKKHAA
jgi:hypothetical protein